MSDIPSIHPNVRIGHVHLKVADLDREHAFYCGVLGSNRLYVTVVRKKLFRKACAVHSGWFQ